MEKQIDQNRMKKEAEKESKSSLINTITDDADIKNEDLNTAFLAFKEEDDDEEANKPTQFTPNDVNQMSREENKENDGDACIDYESTQFVAAERSPSVLIRSPSAWIRPKRPARTETSTHLFTPKSKLDEAKVLKSSGKPCREANQIIWQPSRSKIKTKTVVNSEHKPIDETLIDLTKDANKIITINKSPPILRVQPMFKAKKRIVPYAKPTTPIEKIKTPSKVCEDCYEYHRRLGRDLDKNPPKKFGICSKHHRNVQENLLETPPGFWNPKIIDSESDHEETPYDYRFAKK